MFLPLGIRNLKAARGLGMETIRKSRILHVIRGRGCTTFGSLACNSKRSDDLTQMSQLVAH